MQSGIITAGLINIPLTKPAKVFFISDVVNDEENEGYILQIHYMLKSMHIEYNIDKRYPTNRTFITSNEEIPSSKIKNIFRNFRNLHPHVDSKWRYLNWEIDEQSDITLNYVMDVYRTLELPIYVHKSFRGYHFISLKPIDKDDWHTAIIALRDTNHRYPPQTLRIMANKYPNEIEYFKQGFVCADARHSDTYEFKRLLEAQDIQSIQQKYWIVYYPLPEQNKLDNMTYHERALFQQKQIDDDDGHGYNLKLSEESI